MNRRRPSLLPPDREAALHLVFCRHPIAKTRSTPDPALSTARFITGPSAAAFRDFTRSTAIHIPPAAHTQAPRPWQAPGTACPNALPWHPVTHEVAGPPALRTADRSLKPARQGPVTANWSRRPPASIGPAKPSPLRPGLGRLATFGPAMAARLSRAAPRPPTSAEASSSGPPPRSLPYAP